MMNIVRKYITSASFEDTRSRYSEFPKISFDYEVAEKAHSVAVVPFTGQWKDLGTWNTLTDELRQHTIGNAVLGPKCENTHIINELQNPIFVDGVKDIVVAACPDGILVCAKKETENIKKYVENLTPRPMYEERRWGTYRVLDDTTYSDGSHSLTKSVTLKPAKHISYQIHHHRAETWTFVQGEGIFVLDGVEQYVKAGDTVHIPVEHYHAIKALTELTFIEVQCGNPLIEEDIERFEWVWK
jgi:mannose-1-phosphate guanylyltransferase